MNEVWQEILSGVTVKQKILFLCCLLLVAAFIYFVSSHAFYPQDNIIEEAIEETINKELNIDIDLSPQSEEKKGISHE